MSPFQHGEVFVTDDGAETDLDLGHYERFTHAPLTQANNLTAGAFTNRSFRGAARRLSRQDRAGDPARHQRNQGAVRRVSTAADGTAIDVVIVEIGGTVAISNRFPSSKRFASCGMNWGARILCSFM